MAKDQAAFTAKLEAISLNTCDTVDFSNDGLVASDLELLEAAMTVNFSVTKFTLNRSNITYEAELILDRIIATHPNIIFKVNIDDSLGLTSALGGLSLAKPAVQVLSAKDKKLAAKLQAIRKVETLIADFSNLENSDSDSGSVAEDAELEESNGEDSQIDLPSLSVKDLKSIEEAIEQNPDIIVLNFNDCMLGAECGPILAWIIAKLPKLRKLFLNNNRLDDAAIEAICGALIKHNLGNLRALSLENNQITSVGAEFVGKLLALDFLEELLMDYNPLNNFGVEQLLSGFRGNQKLLLLSLKGCHIHPAGAKAIANAMSNNRLPRLILSENPLGDAGVICFVQAEILQRTIRCLEMDGCEIGDKGAQALGLLIRTSDVLVKISLDENFISSEGMKSMDGSEGLIVGLKDSRTLTCFSISNNNLGDEGVVNFADFIAENCILREVYLQSNNITSEGVKRLALALSVNSSVEILDLSSNKVEDAGAIALAAMLNNNDVHLDLNLDDASIQDEGARALLLILRKNLATISLDDNLISHKVKRDLERYIKFGSVQEEQVVDVQQKRRKILDM